MIFFKSHFQNPLKNPTSYFVEAGFQVGFWEVGIFKWDLKKMIANCHKSFRNLDKKFGDGIKDQNPYLFIAPAKKNL